MVFSAVPYIGFRSSSMMRRDQRPREAVHANRAELTVDRDRRRFNHEGIVGPRSLSDIDLSTTANDPQPSASFSARSKNRET